MIYIFLFLLIFSPYILKKRVKRTATVTNAGDELVHELPHKKKGKLYFMIVSLFMIMLLTLRHDFVGTDTQNYRWLYDTFSEIPFDLALKHINDVGFVFIFQLLSGFGLDFRAALFLQALLYISSVTIIIRRHSKMPALSYWTFITLGYFIFATTMRQAISTAIILFSYELIKKKKMFSFIICIVIAATFHLTALIFFPAYWIYKFRYSRKTLALIITMIMIITVFSGRISSFVLSYSKTEYVATSTGGYFLILYLGALLALGIIYRKNFMVQNNDNKMLFFMVAATFALIPIARINPAVFRITYYYQIFTILYIPNLIASIRDKLTRFILTYGFVIFGIYYFYYKLASYGIRMHPYVFYWNDYPIQIPGLN